MTGQEFRRAWYAGRFKGDYRPELTGLLQDGSPNIVNGRAFGQCRTLV